MYAFFLSIYTVQYTIPNEKKKLVRGTHPTQPCWLGESSVPVNKKCYNLLVLTFTQIKKKKIQILPVEGNWIAQRIAQFQAVVETFLSYILLVLKADLHLMFTKYLQLKHPIIHICPASQVKRRPSAARLLPAPTQMALCLRLACYNF